MRLVLLLCLLANPDGDCTKSGDCERGSYCKAGPVSQRGRTMAGRPTRQHISRFAQWDAPTRTVPASAPSKGPALRRWPK